MKVSFKNGVLEVKLPKSEEVKSRSVNVRLDPGDSGVKPVEERCVSHGVKTHGFIGNVGVGHGPWVPTRSHGEGE